MRFDDLRRKATEAKDRVASLDTSARDGLADLGSAAADGWSNLSAAAKEKLDALLEEYGQAAALLREFDLGPERLCLTAGLLLTVNVSLVGSVERIDLEHRRAMKAAHPDRRLLRTILSAILAAERARSIAKLESLREIKVEVTLGIPPQVSVELR